MTHRPHNYRPDILPPHSIEAEQGVLGCVLLSPLDGIPAARKRLKDEQGREFYDLRHREIWRTLGRMYDDRLEGKPLAASASPDAGIDTITVMQRLKDNGKLDEIGGLAYLSDLPNQTPSAANLGYYLEIVHEKFALREMIGLCTEVVSRAYEHQGQMTHLVHSLQDDFAGLARLASPPESAETMYLKPSQMGDGLMQRWFGRKKGVHGLLLPELAFGNFPFLVRTRELTLMEAETKMGKSTITSYAVLHLMRQGMRAILDSREVHFEETLNKLVMQLTGVSEVTLCPAGEAQGRDNGYVTCGCAACRPAVKGKMDAMKWLEARVQVNRTTGIKHWRDILEAFHVLATEEGYNLFVLDSLMRIGIADDDFTQQAECVSAFAQFCIETNSAMWLINHRNKGNGDYRKKSGGSYKVAANASNICSVEKNEAKFEALAQDFDSLRNKVIDWDEFLRLDNVKKWLPRHDAKFYVHDQRLDGTRSNAARELWFLKRSGQYFDHRHPRPNAPVDWLAQWTARDKHDDPADGWPKEQRA